jgi:hypothetical protein
MADKIDATGASGSTYNLYLHAIGTSYKPIAGVYMFLKIASQGKWDTIYIGETSNLDERLNTGLQRHQAWQCISRNGATHIATMAVGGGAQARINIETDLRHSHNTPCNGQ